MAFDYDNATPEELWAWCHTNYRTGNPLKRLIYRKFFSNIEEVVSSLDPDDSVLEVGCGTGESSLRIAEFLKGQHFEISDVDDRFISQMHKNDFPIKSSRESVYDLQRQDNEFDLVLLLEVLEHLEDFDRALKELFRVSRKYVVVSVPREPLWRIMNMLRGAYLKDFGNTIGHINHWSTSGITDLVSHFGTVVKVYKPLPWTIVFARVNK